MVLLPGLDLDEALQTAERLRVLIHDRSQCSISLGAASLEPGDAMLFQRADDALRASKRQGRNGPPRPCRVSSRCSRSEPARA